MICRKEGKTAFAYAKPHLKFGLTPTYQSCKAIGRQPKSSDGGPKEPSISHLRCCGADGRTCHSLRERNHEASELTVCVWKAGRTAAWAFDKMLRDPGRIGVLVGSQRLYNQEMNESGFRFYFRAHNANFMFR